MTTKKKKDPIVETNKLPLPPGEEHLEGLTPKQVVFTKEIAAMKADPKRQVSLTDAAIKAYDTKNRATAGARGSQTLASPNVRRAYLAELAKYGVDEQSVSRAHSRVLTAKKTVRDKQTGKVIGQDPDYQAQLGAVKEFNKIAEKYPVQKHSIEKKSAHLHVITDMTEDEIKKQMKELNEEIKELGE